MPSEVRFHPEAREEYLDTIRWYVTHSEAIARAFQREVYEAVDRIKEGPSHCPIFSEQVRWIRLHRFPYLLYFEEFSSSHVVVLAVAHANRRPGLLAESTSILVHMCQNTTPIRDQEVFTPSAAAERSQ